MEAYLLFFSILGLSGYRIFRRKRIREKILFSSLFLFALLALLLHPWFRSASPWLRFVEKAALLSGLVGLVSESLWPWMEKRRKRKMVFSLLKNGRGPLFEIVTACRMLSENQQGGLIAIERKTSLEPWILSGVSLDSKIRRETLYSIFTPPGALHDGGTIIREDRIASSGALFPLSERLDLPTELGTRHRAALGLSELTDAVVIVISEETGKISLADQGSLLYDVKIEMLPEMLGKALQSRLVRAKKKPLPRSHPPRTHRLPLVKQR